MLISCLLSESSRPNLASRETAAPADGLVDSRATRGVSAATAPACVFQKEKYMGIAEALAPSIRVELIKAKPLALLKAGDFAGLATSKDLTARASQHVRERVTSPVSWIFEVS